MELWGAIAASIAALAAVGALAPAVRGGGGGRRLSEMKQPLLPDRAHDLRLRKTDAVARAKLESDEKAELLIDAALSEALRMAEDELVVASNAVRARCAHSSSEVEELRPLPKDRGEEATSTEAAHTFLLVVT